MLIQRLPNKHQLINDIMVTFDDNTVKHLQKLNFKSKAIKFVLGDIKIFEAIIFEMK